LCALRGFYELEFAGGRLRTCGVSGGEQKLLNAMFTKKPAEDAKKTGKSFSLRILPLQAFCLQTDGLLGIAESCRFLLEWLAQLLHLPGLALCLRLVET
jgi:hypothetical protein